MMPTVSQERLATRIREIMRPGLTHLLVAPVAGAVPQGVMTPFDLIDLLTRP